MIETTALGAAWLAGHRVGLYPDRDGFAARWTADRTFAPAMDPDHRAARYAAWKRAVAATISV